MATNDDLDDFFKKKDRKGKHKKQAGLLTNNQELLKQLEIVTSATSAFKENMDFDDDDEPQINDESILGTGVTEEARKHPIKHNKIKNPDNNKSINEPDTIISNEGQQPPQQQQQQSQQQQDEWEDFEGSNSKYEQLRLKFSRINNDNDYDDEFYDDENNPNNNDNNNDMSGDRQQQKDKPDKQQLVPTKKKDENVDDEELQQQASMDEPRPSIAEEILDFLIPSTPDPLKNPTKRDLSRTMWVSVLIIIFLSLLYSITTLTHFSSFKYEITDETKLDVIVNETIRLVAHCERISDSRLGNLIFFPIAVGLIIIFSWSTKRERKCLNTCDGRPGLIPPIEPFRTSNRFTTATIFGILSFEVLKIFEELLFRAADPFNHGVLVEIIERIAIVVLVGLRYYPVLASLQLRNVISRLLICLYVLGDIIFAIVREGSCMGFLPLSRYYSSIEEAKLRMELGTWFIVYGLIKTTPHFIFLSYIGAELCVRFAYDSIYVPLKKNQSIWSAPVVQQDEYEFAKYYVAKLFRQNFEQKQKRFEKFRIINKLDQQIPTTKTKKTIYPSRVKNFFNSIYHWDENFRFTTIATCTYTVAIVFLYYLACTFVFLYISRTTGHTLFLRYYIQSMINIEIKGLFSLRLEIITSAVIAFIIYAFQLFLGIQNYKKHKLDLFKGIYEDVPSPANFRPNAIVSKSVHYSGFLVGYMAWGFLICFHLIFLFLSFIRFITFQMRYFELVLAITVPVTVVYLLKMVTASSAGKFLFMQSDYEKINIDNRKTYAIFVYFNFFADCFLGVASCIIRLIKATFLNLVYMARLDYSFLGRPIEKFDLGYAAYVSYLHMEVTHTHPVMLANFDSESPSGIRV
ncbi:unnamed protein product [Rotaria sp. Silwood1]|nr:unnamed protein product [Rotaria sp. Silwood1]